MEYLENDFAQIEHVNQIVANNLKHDSWDCFDTTKLLEQHPELGVYNTNNPPESYVEIPANKKDTRGKLITEFPNIRYNSILVSIKKLEDYYVYTFEVRNSLWDGQFKVTKTRKNNDGDYETFSDSELIPKKINTEGANNNIIAFYVKGSDKQRIRVCFHMSMAGNGRKIDINNLELTLEHEDYFEHQYDETIYEPGKLLLNNGQKAVNSKVSIIPCNKSGQELTEGIPSHELTNKNINEQGEFSMPYGAVKTPGTYYCLMTAESSDGIVEDNSIIKKIIQVDKIQDEEAYFDWGDEAQYKNVWKGSIKKYKIYIHLKNKYGQQSKNEAKLVDTFVNVYFIKASGVKTSQKVQVQEEGSDDTKKYFIEFEISYRNYYDNTSRIELSLDPLDGYGNITSQRIIEHPWFIAKSFNDIISQLYLTNNNGAYVTESGTTTSNPVENEYGTDWIFLDPRVKYNVTKTIIIQRDLTIASIHPFKNNPAIRSVLYANNNNIIQTKNDGDVSKLIKVNLIGIGFSDAECAIHMGSGTRLLIDKCFFTNNKNEGKHHRGSSIYMPWTDWSVKNKHLWKTEIRNSYFINNKGNEIQSVGTTKIVGNLFKTTESKYLQQPEVKVVAVRAGSVEYRNNKSYINTGTTPMKSNHSYAKALAYVEKNATFNGVGPNKLGGDMTLPLYKNYNNQAYTYSIYYYPYGNVRTEIVCSPRRGYERRATGHSSTFKNWVFYDGYYFVRWENGRNKGNRKNPWTEEELALPKDLGIFNLRQEKFIDDYDPRFSGAKSNTSSFD